MAKTSNLDKIIAERAATYGNYTSVAESTWKAYRAFADNENFESLPAEVKFSIVMILNKIGRIVNGKITLDSLDDIQGYTELLKDLAEG